MDMNTWDILRCDEKTRLSHLIHIHTCSGNAEFLRNANWILSGDHPSVKEAKRFIAGLPNWKDMEITL